MRQVLNSNINTCAYITVDIRRCDEGIRSGLIESALEFARFRRNTVGALQGHDGGGIIVIIPTAAAVAGCRNVSYDPTSVIFRVRNSSSSSRTIKYDKTARQHNNRVTITLSYYYVYAIVTLRNVLFNGIDFAGSHRLRAKPRPVPSDAHVLSAGGLLSAVADAAGIISDDDPRL